MGTQLNSITSTNWTMSIGQQGKVLTDLDDINQCIYIILTTIPGTDSLRPLFGCGIYARLDQPLNIAIPLMINDIKNAISNYEPRVTVSNVTYQLVGTSIIFTVYYNSNYGNSFVSTPSLQLAA